MQFPVSRFGWLEEHARLAGSLDDHHFHIREYRELSSHSSTRRFSFLCNHQLFWIAEDVDSDGESTETQRCGFGGVNRISGELGRGTNFGRTEPGKFRAEARSWILSCSEVWLSF